MSLKRRTKLQRREKRKESFKVHPYRDGGDGFIRWAEDNVSVPVFHEGSDIPRWTPIKDLPSTPNPETGRSYHELWKNQKRFFRSALRMRNGRFLHRLIVLCWMRGEGKSLIACIIQLWKFFCWPRQQIMLGANSKDQVKFVHFDIMRDIIINSPNLIRVVGRRNVQEKEIRIKDRKGNVASIIRSISSFSGIVSNITGYTFSEIFDMKNPKFFVQLDGSIRNIPNAMGVIDSTVSAKDHILYKLYDTYMKKKDPSLFFSYRCTRKGKHEDFWNPQMTQMQLDSYRNKFPKDEFERYFLNLWSAGAQKLFTEPMIMASHYLGVDGTPAYKPVLTITEELDHIRVVMEELVAKGLEDPIDMSDKRSMFESRLTPLPYTLSDRYGFPRMAGSEKLEELSDLLDTDWCIGCGLDRADPMKSRTAARTMLTFVAKGLPGSRSNPAMYLNEGVVPNYVYFLLHLAHIEDSSIEEIKRVIGNCSEEYDGIDTLCSERWGIWDMRSWFESQGIPLESVTPNYERQKAAFSELYNLYRNGRFKAPVSCIPGSRSPDILEEELIALDHDPYKKWYGSPEKRERHGIQDDSVYALAWCIYGMRDLSIENLRERKGFYSFGEFKNPEELVATY